VLAGASISLFAVDLETLTRDFRERPLTELARARPRGRAVKVLLRPALAAADTLSPTARALIPAADARLLFEALVEDRAEAVLYDAPQPALAELCAALSRAARSSPLQLAALESAPSAYPQELRGKETTAGLVTWISDPRVAAAAASAVHKLDVPKSVDPELWNDLAHALGEILAAAGKPRMAIVGSF